MQRRTNLLTISMMPPPQARRELLRTPSRRSSQNMAWPRSRQPVSTKANNTSARYYVILMYSAACSPFLHIRTQLGIGPGVLWRTLLRCTSLIDKSRQAVTTLRRVVGSSKSCWIERRPILLGRRPVESTRYIRDDSGNGKAGPPLHLGGVSGVPAGKDGTLWSVSLPVRGQYTPSRARQPPSPKS